MTTTNEKTAANTMPQLYHVSQANVVESPMKLTVSGKGNHGQKAQNKSQNKDSDQFHSQV
jgi:hypothetical protein